MVDPCNKTTIVTAYAESASGPGWANAPIWIITRDSNGVLHEDCIQPSEQTPEMAALYGISQAAHLAMKKAVTGRKRAIR